MAHAERNLVVVAHPDDDLIFIEPDILQSASRGAATRTVFVTAGEFDGNGTTREAYAGQRRAGICAAYSLALGVGDLWARNALAFAGRPVDVSTLVAAPNVELIFLGLPDGFDALQPAALTRLWADGTETAWTIVYPESPVQDSLVYRRADLIAVLRALVAEFAPTVVRSQDPAPDTRRIPDHPDHIAAAMFTAEALRSSAGAARTTLVQFCDFPTQDRPQNLTDAVADDKRLTFETYAMYDSAAGGPAYVWLRRQYRRWPTGTAWVGMDGQDRLHAFAVQGDTVWNWRQPLPGGTFAEPEELPGVAVAPTLGVGTSSDGRVAVFGVDLDSHDVVVAEQNSAGGPYSGWESLGNPNGPGAPHTGAPGVGANADGRLQVFVTNGGGGVSTAYQMVGEPGFSEWVDFGGGPDVLGVPACVLRPDGRMALFAATSTGIRRWWQSSPNAGWDDPVDLIDDQVGSSPTAILNADGRLEVFWRGEAADVRTAYEVALGGPWTTTPTSLGGHGGVGDVAALLAGGEEGRIFLLTRNGGGGASATAQSAPNVGFDAWTDLGGVTPGTPTLAPDRLGMPTGFQIATDGSLLTTGATDDRRTAVLARAVTPGPLTGFLRRLPWRLPQPR